jgi:N-acetylglucosamine-6-sulfatase
MTMRSIQIALMVAVSLLALGGMRLGTAQPATPNIIFILTDDLNADLIEFMPNLKQQLVAQGTTLKNFFVNVSLCCPSRANILRGQYAHNTQVLTNLMPTGGFEKFYALGHESSTVATWLQAAGYRTFYLGKYLNGYPASVSLTHVPPGWTEWYSPVAGNPYSNFNYVMNENGKLVRYGSRADDYLTDVVARKSIDFIKRAAAEGQPFFIHLALYVPHSPATPAPRHAELFPDAQLPRPPSFNEPDVSDKPSFIRNRPLLTERQIAQMQDLYRKRLQSLQAVDEMLASLIATLQATGQLEHTYIFFTSDNGFHMGEHRLNSGKQTAYEEDIRVLLIVRGPGCLRGGCWSI